jgi:BirA family biotin operon repressor/biotin-[acetyl-CoA-carboxylase] ligase
VTADAQTAGRGRQGRRWEAPPSSALLCSIVLRDPPELLPLAGGLAVARAIGDGARIKWPNDVLLPAGPGAAPGRKVAGILAEGRPQDGWAVIGIGVNVAVRLEDLPPELHDTAATLGLTPADRAIVLERILRELESAITLDTAALLAAYRERDALRGRAITWSGGTGVAAGIDGSGRLVLDLPDGGHVALDAGEVHLGRV